MKKKPVLIAVIKTPRDLDLLLRERWYRIPDAHAPKRGFTHIAFYQPASFGNDSGKIRYYAAVRSRETAERPELLPDEPLHPHAKNRYLRYGVWAPRRLKKPIVNMGRERVCFGYTTMGRLKSARDIHGLFGVPPLEKIIGKRLKKAGLDFSPEYAVIEEGRCRYRLDFAVFCRYGKLDIECDGHKCHCGPAARKKDAQRDARLVDLGWTVLRLSEHEIVLHKAAAVSRVREAAQTLGTSC
ncbi:MAG: DUF559 domain-containing protein [Elusimicrobia bacterium]|nr:DUF559 domain-containing protein [Elusimicrobiota bacterium]